MLKYRMLTKEEMEIFDEDFKHFMIANGVTNEEWIEWNKSNIEKATQLVELFSDTVLQKVYEKIKFVEFRSEDSCIVFKCDLDQMEMISLNRKDDAINLSNPDSIHQSILKNPEKITFFKSKKNYSTLREQEIHNMINQGCFNSTEAFWNALMHLFEK